MDTFEAIDILELGAEGDPVAAMQSLIDSGVVWSLQGSYGRAASAGLASGQYQHPQREKIAAAWQARNVPLQ